MASERSELVLVTGGSGYIAMYCIMKCLAEGYQVRTTIRSLKREQEVRDMLRTGGCTRVEDLSFIEADLTKGEGWVEAVKGCTYVLHVASPFSATMPKHEDDFIIPAREGTLRVLRAAKNAGVKRVVLTSSSAAVAGGHKNWDYSVPFTAKDWSNIAGPGMDAYGKSKTIAERAAWDYIEKDGGTLELTTVLPVAVLGPVLGADTSPSIEIVSRLLNGIDPGCPRLTFGIVDVRDVADLHYLAMIKPEAKGHRFICSAPTPMSMKDMSLALRDKLGKQAKRAPTLVLPDFVVKLIALFDTSAAFVVPMLGKVVEVSIDDAKNLLGWQPRSSPDAVVATGESLIKLGLVKV